MFTPSVMQAAVAAILRNADLTNQNASRARDPTQSLVGPVRNGLSYLDGIRQGASLGALMGQRAEEALADADLSAYIQPLREEFPLIANKLVASSGSQTASDVAAPNVVDGVALEGAITGGTVNWAEIVAASGASLSTAAAASAEGSLSATLSFLSDDFAAITDLSTSESTFQIVRGNPERAGSILDAIQSGTPLPEPQVVETPRTGLSVTHRVVTLSEAYPQVISPGTELPLHALQPSRGWKDGFRRCCRVPRMSCSPANTPIRTRRFR